MSPTVVEVLELLDVELELLLGGGTEPVELLEEELVEPLDELELLADGLLLDSLEVADGVPVEEELEVDGGELEDEEEELGVELCVVESGVLELLWAF